MAQLKIQTLNESIIIIKQKLYNDLQLIIDDELEHDNLIAI